MANTLKLSPADALRLFKIAAYVRAFAERYRVSGDVAPLLVRSWRSTPQADHLLHQRITDRIQPPKTWLRDQLRGWAV